MLCTLANHPVDGYGLELCSGCGCWQRQQQQQLWFDLVFLLDGQAGRQSDTQAGRAVDISRSLQASIAAVN